MVLGYNPFPLDTTIFADVRLDGFASGATWDSSTRTLTGTMPSDLDGIATTVLDSGDTFSVVIADVTGDKCGLFIVKDTVTSESPNLILCKLDGWEERDRAVEVTRGTLYDGFVHAYDSASESFVASRPTGGEGSTNLYVNPSSPSTGTDGSLESPFRTINEALAVIEAAGDAASDNRYTVHLSAGIHSPFVCRVPYTTILGAGRDATVIQGTGEVCAFFTNTTEASRDTWYGNDGDLLANGDTQYTDLVKDSSLAYDSPIGSHLSDVTLTRTEYDSSSMSLAYICRGADLDAILVGSTRLFCNIYAYRSTAYFRNASWLQLENVDYSADMYARQVRVFYVLKSRLRTLNTTFNTSDERSASPYDSLSSCRGEGNMYTVNLEAENASGTMYFSEYNSTVSNNLDLGGSVIYTGVTSYYQEGLFDDSPDVTLQGCHFDAALTLSNPGTPSFNLKGTYVGGAIVLPAGGTKTFTMSGGAYMGALTDPDGVFSGTAPTGP